MKHRELIKLYFELEKMLQQDRGDEFDAVQKIIDTFQDEIRKRLGHSESSRAAEARVSLTEKLISIRATIKKENNPPKSVLGQPIEFLMEMLKNFIGTDLDNVISKKREMEIERIAKEVIAEGGS